ncbi:RNA polymerase sigma factor [Anaeromyxobacter sp. PSR-1]|uniref:RNA polymerase sigma factor n=1 Tax=unclassified Anaeromyxobacter TaxID=2620896 RepID=UPI0005DBD528|nr:sigma-70 family RNA polymerase sigma factor [Anaeromyxobacter sp. PSR-1]GAO02078.1 RNA polymerase sigma-H factor [Anaeromyxobacter sp. PSR-1]
MADDVERGRPTLRVVPGGARSGPPAAPGPAATPGAPAAISDEVAVAAFLAGDDRAFGEVVRHHERLVLALVRRYARTPEDARDLAQRTFLRAFEAARRTLARGGAGAVPFRRWLVRVAVNLGKNHLRDETRWTRAPLEALDRDAATPAAAHEAAVRAEREARVRRAVLGLPRRQREVLTLRIDAELPFSEIAAALGTTENSAKVSFHHAVRRLQALAGEEESP